MRWSVSAVLGLLPVALVIAVAVASQDHGTAASHTGRPEPVVASRDEGTGASFASRTQSACQSAQASLATGQPPTDLSQAVAWEQSRLDIYSREVKQLGAIQPPSGVAASYRAGIADDEALLGMLGSMIHRPDYVRLAVTLPGHPQRIPAWLKDWLARSHALLADAHSRFAQAELPSCERSLG